MAWVLYLVSSSFIMVLASSKSFMDSQALLCSSSANDFIRAPWQCCQDEPEIPMRGRNISSLCMGPRRVIRMSATFGCSSVKLYVLSNVQSVCLFIGIYGMTVAECGVDFPIEGLSLKWAPSAFADDAFFCKCPLFSAQ